MTTICRHDAAATRRVAAGGNGPMRWLWVDAMKRRDLMRHYRDPHVVLKPLRRAAALARDVGIVRIPMPIPDISMRLPGVLRSLIRQGWLVTHHLALRDRLTRRGETTLVIREFVTIPLLIAAPTIYRERDRLWFLIQHNLQSAKRRAWERRALRMLQRAGFNFLLFDDADCWRDAVGTDCLEHVAKIPFPVLPPSLHRSLAGAGRRHDRPVVGVIGNFRPEKNPEVALSGLIAARDSGRLRIDVLLGCSNRMLRERWASRLETVDTTTQEQYLDALTRCSVLVLSYNEEAYFYRSSGVIAEAVAMGVRVVCPAFPILERQIGDPAVVGVSYGSEAGIVAAVEKALALPKEEFLQAREQHLQVRGVESLAGLLRKLRTHADDGG